MQLHLSPSNVSDAVDTAMLLCYELAHSKGIHLTWFVEPTIPPLMLVDSTRLQQIILNLLSNGQAEAQRGWQSRGFVRSSASVTVAVGV